MKICSVKISSVNMFISRNEEINNIKNFLKDGNSLLLYGLKRIGKTTLIKEALNKLNRNYIYFECIKASEPVNIEAFKNLLKEITDYKDNGENTFLEIFKNLNKERNSLVIVIDEYSYLKEYYFASKKMDSNLEAIRIDSEFQVIIDQYLDRNKLILCGSSISTMKDLLSYNSPLYGRFSTIINLKPFNYLDVKMMFPSLSNNQIVEIYSLFGGSPYVLSKINPNKSLKENICELLLNEDGILRTHIEMNVLGEMGKDPDLNLILKVIKNGVKKYGDLEQKLSLQTSGLLDKKLKKLIDLDIVEKQYPIGFENNKRKTHYALKDNLLKFYYSYIYGNENLISLLGTERFFELKIVPSIEEFISRRFECMVRDYFSLLSKTQNDKTIVNIGSYFTNENEYDCVIKRDNNKYEVYEVKYTKKPIDLSTMHKEIVQIKQIPGLKISKIGFVSASGFTQKINEVEYIDLDKLFDINN